VHSVPFIRGISDGLSIHITVVQSLVGSSEQFGPASMGFFLSRTDGHTNSLRNESEGYVQLGGFLFIREVGDSSRAVLGEGRKERGQDAGEWLGI